MLCPVMKSHGMHPAVLMLFHMNDLEGHRQLLFIVLLEFI